MGSPCWRSL